MTEERDTPDDLYPFAEMLVKQLTKQHQLRWGKHRTEDAIQDLFLAGWQVWRDEQDVGLAKNRILDRSKNLLRDFQSELEHEPKTGTSPPRSKIPDSGELWDEGAIQAWDPPDPRVTIRGDPAEDAARSSYLGTLIDRQRQIVLMRMAGCTAQDADELGLSLRTVERELETLRKDFPHDDAE